MNIQLIKATNSDAELLFAMQVKAFKPLLRKHRDYDTNPAAESIDKMMKKINWIDGTYYKILLNNLAVGGVFIYWKEYNVFRISPLYILPAYQGNGIAQKVLHQLEDMYPEARSWELFTIFEEERNCYLYEKMGFIKTGPTKKINERATLILYRK
ncbi:GNAT family N-acetyltransferase [Aquibacillus kalidii]|uniref:GNAT family N-acetyltransferase n=1 Tax=Aquibacillus kalidii TaxID=2762597 RepID=UPI001648448A|nr:GNAT family N-acetyltransferase [Aquibacillus kalidii]